MLALAVALAAAPVIVSPGPARVALTLYRAPARRRGQAMDLAALGGFALVSETRTVRLPAGEAVIRFEGVAGGIVPVSAIVAGLPGGTIEKNRDARVLTPAALVDGSLGRIVTLTRTDRVSGRTMSEEATILAGPDEGVVLRTAAGIETLGCAGLAEATRYPRVPAGLTPTPTLSVTTRSPAPAEATVTLSYLASGFDWSASYVATLAPGGRTLDLFAWATLANANAQAFRDATVQAVAGRLERQRLAPVAEAAAGLSLQCYPLGTTTSDLRRKAMDAIVVTASRRMAAPMMAMAAPPPPPPPPEDLGDLKLYRLPEAVDVAANAQKQVALLHRSRVAVERIYSIALMQGQTVAAMPATIRLRLRNVAATGLGVPLPAGTTALYAQAGDARLLAGLGTLADTAVGERTTLTAGLSHQLLAKQERGTARRMRLTVTNAAPRAAVLEVGLGRAGDALPPAPSRPLARIDGVPTWQVTVPANGSATLAYDRP